MAKVALLSDYDQTRQAGAELCQAHVELGLAKLALTRKKLRAYKLEVTFHSKRG
jgi:hypothetical protein